MLRVGLTGGLATGKTFVGRALADLGCRLLSADELGHQALLPGAPAYLQAVEAFGGGILDAHGRIDRRKLGAVVFGDPEKLELLNSFVHPAVIAAEEQWMKSVQAEDPLSIAVVEAAILIETGSYRRFDKLVLTVCTDEQQIARAIKRDGLTRQEVLDRLKRQMPLEEKRRYADYVIDTSGEKDGTLAQVGRLYTDLRSLRV
ncbi:dephospho-CoA kinase [Paludibaculum fermentans]|uniref:Dephospho-CoA kinase n=1 Tax=Paludibaculum fermentans TaxID=1473598 RepID=A0A7S7NVD5_PALFE|nr:dephospho-CoA kinase [Paludibaculum fermentans]QOY90513.1 dephospho-CoA kinase [Paludibaculum fermentans]